MESRNAPDVAVITSAVRIVYQEKWQICAQRAAAHLATASSVRWSRLFPDSAVIRVVAIDGVVNGQVRGHRGLEGPGRRGQVAGCGAFQTDVWALACSGASRSAVPMIDPKPAAKEHFPVWSPDCHDTNKRLSAQKGRRSDAYEKRIRKGPPWGRQSKFRG
ncbi:MAG TPA: hypothetical protein VMB04_15480 [Mycobacterium sp.]|nr:hypothetical protein [Mycobacterium sp.]